MQAADARAQVAHEPRFELREVVAMDEYTHDVVLAAPDGSVLAIGAT